jgi:hypothetical protein
MLNKEFNDFYSSTTINVSAVQITEEGKDGACGTHEGEEK